MTNLTRLYGVTLVPDHYIRDRLERREPSKPFSTYQQPQPTRSQQLPNPNRNGQLMNEKRSENTNE